MNDNDEHEYSRIADLISLRISSGITAAEQAELDQWLAGHPERQAIYDRLTDEAERHRALRQLGRFDEDAAWARFEEKVMPINRPRKLWRFTAAAAVVAGLLFGAYFISQQRQKPLQVAQNAPVVPGGKKAMLILANGRHISLTDAHAGTLAQQGHAVISKSANGQVVYSGGSNTTDAIAYNTIVTPRGGYYPLQMADGTIAILDAGSSIRYPVNFRDGQDRLVTVTGQVYFEVRHNSKQPFKLQVKGQVIEDIGTIFNINAYDDEPVIRTTLVDGSIRVQNMVLKPGQQTDGSHISSVNTSDVIAWKNGQTSFEGESVQEIMRQVSRWYDVDVVYQGTMPQRQFTGGIPRNASIDNLLKALSFEDIHVTLQGKKLLVKP